MRIQQTWFLPGWDDPTRFMLPDERFPEETEADKKRRLARERKRKQRDRSHTKSVTGVTESGTSGRWEGEKGGGFDGLESFSSQNHLNKTDADKEPEPKPYQPPQTARLCVTPNVTLSVTDPKEPMPTTADILKQWPASAGMPPTAKQVNLALRQLVFAGHSQEAALTLIYKRVQAYAAGKFVETTQPAYRPGWAKWVEAEPFAAAMPAWWFQPNAASTSGTRPPRSTTQMDFEAERSVG